MYSGLFIWIAILGAAPFVHKETSQIEKKQNIMNPVVFKWFENAGKKIAIEIHQGDRFVHLESDGLHVVPQSIKYWCVKKGHFEDGSLIWSPSNAVTVNEAKELFSSAITFLSPQSSRPIIVLIKDSHGFETWSSILNSFSGKFDSVVTITEFEYKLKGLDNRLSHAGFGTDLMISVARRLSTGKTFYNCHKEYCGHGLHFKDGIYCLVSVYDGVDFENIAEWKSAESFVQFFSKQSDFTCSGADQQCCLFRTDDPWRMFNQTITKAELEKFVEG